MKRSIALVTVALGFSSLCVKHARADAPEDQRAAQLEEQATALTKTRDFRGALGLYQEALVLAPTPKRQCNVGAAYFKLDDWAPAHFFLGLCLSHTGTLPAAAVEQMSKAFAYADRQLQAGAFAKVLFTSQPPGATLRLPTLDAAASFKAPRTVWLRLAEHIYEASADGYAPTRQQFNVTADPEKKTQKITIELAPIVSAPSPTAEPETTEPTLSLTPPDHPSKTESDTASSRPAWITLSAGAGLTLVGGVFHLRAVGVRSDLEGRASGPTRDGLIEDLKRERTLMAGFYGAGAIALGVGAYLLFSTSAETADPRPHVSVSEHGGCLGVGWGF